MNSNPLTKFFRQPAIYIRLPSGGKGWRPGSLTLPENGEVPIMPMTAIDEIIYRTPDALFNGEAVTGVIQSCCPSVQDAWACPSVDLDVLLVAIRIASYGHSMDIDSTCPACGEEHSFGLDLRTVIDNLKSSDFDKEFVQNDLTFYFRPLSYREVTDNSLVQYEQQRILQSVNASETLPEAEKVSQLNVMMKKLVGITVKAISQSIVEIRTPNGIVQNQGHIEEFINNCDRNMFNAIRDHVIGMRENSELQPLTISCPSCTHEYQQAFTLDMSNFFVSAS
jgi:hypothetical protein